MDFVEITLPVAWGHVAAKAWGDEKDPIVLAMHGYRDNANSFDGLIPLLPKSYYYISIDLPSHGKSTHIPTRTIIHLTDFVLAVKQIFDYLNRQKYIILSHSFGSQTGILFSQLYPEYVEKLICIDSIYYLPVGAKSVIFKLREIYDLSEKLRDHSIETAPTYTIDEAVERLRASRIVQISEQAARALIMRSLTPAGNGKYRITTDQRLKYASLPAFSQEYQVGILRENPVQCPHLSIGATETKPYRFMIPKVIEQFKKNRKFELVVVKGNHDVHIEHPERVAPIITKFMLQNNSKL